MEILKCEHLTRKYGEGETQITALNDVSFTVNQGEFIAIIGPSGSGKSTLLHILGGVDKSDGGTVTINGQDIFALADGSGFDLCRKIRAKSDIPILFSPHSMMRSIP